MEASIESVSSVTKNLTIVLPAETVSEAIDAYAKKLRGQVKIDGFRKGKVPLDIVKSYYRDDIKHTVSNNLIADSYPQALEKTEAAPISYPKIKDFSELKPGKTFTYKAEIDVKPVIEIKNYKAIEIEVTEKEPLQPAIDREMDTYRNQMTTNKELETDRPLAVDDIANIDYCGSVDGVNFPGGEAKGHDLEIGLKQFIPGFEEALVGMNKGESRTIDITFPEDYQSKDLAGKAAKFDVTLHAIKTKELPELNQEFAKKFGFDDLEKMTEDVTTRLQKQIDDRYKNEAQQKILEKIITLNPFDVPPSSVENSIDQLIDRAFNAHGASNGKIPEKQMESLRKNPQMRKNFEDQAGFMVRSRYIIEEVSKAENIAVNDDDLTRHLEKMAGEMNMSLKEVEAKINATVRDDIRSQLVHERTVDLLEEHATITPTKEKV